MSDRMMGALLGMLSVLMVLASVVMAVIDFRLGTTIGYVCGAIWVGSALIWLNNVRLSLTL